MGTSGTPLPGSGKAGREADINIKDGRPVAPRTAAPLPKALECREVMAITRSALNGAVEMSRQIAEENDAALLVVRGGRGLEDRLREAQRRLGQCRASASAAGATTWCSVVQSLGDSDLQATSKRGTAHAGSGETFGYDTNGVWRSSWCIIYILISAKSAPLPDAL